MNEKTNQLVLPWRFGVVVSALVSINEVNLCRARLVLRWVTVSGVQSLVPENLSQYITSHSDQLSLAIPPRVSVMSTNQRAVMPCGWGVKAGMVREWVAVKTVRSPCYHGPCLSALAMGSFHNRVLYKCPITLLYLLPVIYIPKVSAKRYGHCWTCQIPRSTPSQSADGT